MIGFYLGVTYCAVQKNIWIAISWIILFPLAFRLEYIRQKKENELENRKIKKG